MREKWVRPVVTEIAVTNGYSSQFGRVLAECGDGPYPTFLVLEDDIQDQLGLAMFTLAHLPEPAHADMVVHLDGKVPVRLTERLSQSGTAVSGLDGAWRARPVVA